ncbi:MAG: hypothetical protein KC560_04635 [Myxococcales bacterium]|nr:hypothetical protein [Myxococcales bacterium]
MILDIERTWDGGAALPGERVRIALSRSARGARDDWRIEVDAPFHGDPAPASPPGPTPRLFEHEVVEVFLLALPDTYLEVELGPHGHHLVLALEGVRNAVREELAIAYAVAREGARWRGVAVVPGSLVPAGVSHVNAFAIHGAGAARRHLAWRPAAGRAPDFHRLDVFAPFDAEALRVG